MMPTVPAASTFTAYMAQGMAAHEAGDRVLALTAFEAALALAPGHVQAASACATLLFELARPKAAFACLRTVETQLLEDADGAANLGIAAAACGERETAKRHFLQALSHDAGHPRALQHLAALYVEETQWETALTFTRRWQAAAASRAGPWTTMAEVLIGAGRLEEALAHLERALQRFPGQAALTLRHAVVLAIRGDFGSADGLLASLASSGEAIFLAQALQGDARSIFIRHAFDAMQVCDWRFQDRLLALFQLELRAGSQEGSGRDMRATLVCGPVLPLSQEDMLLTAQAVRHAATAGPAQTGRPFSAADVLNRQGPVRLGIAAHSLRDEAATAELAALLALHDSSRFDIHVYSCTPQPQAALAQSLAPHRVVEIAHFSDHEAIARIRLDRLDIWLDLTFGSPGWRPALSARRVAPVQLQHPGWPAPSGAPFDYTLSDAFIHPRQNPDRNEHGALIRLPHTCWPAMHLPPGNAAPAVTREQAGLPAQALVLCAFAPALHIDAHSFGIWMQVLDRLPEAVLWLPPLGPAAQANLMREAEAAGIAAQRLRFAVAHSRRDRLACLALADLFLDPLRISARQDLRDALALGVPALSCAGLGTASRAGGSMLHAAGLADCVADHEDAYVASVLRLGRDRPALQQLRLRLQASRATAPLFDLPARVRELEAAWAFMAGRARAGLPPESLNLTAQSI